MLDREKTKLPGLSKSPAVLRGARGSTFRPGVGGLLKVFEDLGVFGVFGLLPNGLFMNLESGDEKTWIRRVGDSNDWLDEH